LLGQKILPGKKAGLMMRPINKRNVRLPVGAALVEGVVALMLVIGATVGACLLLTNIGMSIYYKEKLSFVSNQCAQYARYIPGAEDAEVKTAELAKSLLKAMGIKASRCDVKVKDTLIEGVPAISVSITAMDLHLFGNGELLPGTLSLQDTAVALKGTAPDTLLWFARNPQVSGYLLPVVKVPPDGVNSLGVPVTVR
jgi:hypothetical protein